MGYKITTFLMIHNFFVPSLIYKRIKSYHISIIFSMFAYKKVINHD